VTHGYSAYIGEKSQENVVMYHHYDISKSKQMSFNNWINLEVNFKKPFEVQFYPMNCIPIGLDGYTTKVHQMHISKNSYIKPYIDVSDLDASFILWFAKGNPNGGCFGTFQHCLKFDNNN
jgi:hypothetical protein